MTKAMQGSDSQGITPDYLMNGSANPQVSLQSSEWLDEILETTHNEYWADWGVDDKGQHRMIIVVPEAKQAILKKFEEAQVEARIDELKRLEQSGTNTFRARVRHVYTEQRLAELDSPR